MYRRRLPHVFETAAPVFFTWRLAGSLPWNRPFPPKSATTGKAFLAMDRLLDSGLYGPTYLRQPELAEIVVQAIHFGQQTLGNYEWHAYAVMPNHVHLLATPKVPLPKLTRALKGYTAKRCNQVLGLTGRPFWQDETFDRTLRAGQAERIRAYIEHNPVKAGLACQAEEFPWSSAFRGPEALSGTGVPPPRVLDIQLARPGRR